MLAGMGRILCGFVLLFSVSLFVLFCVGLFEIIFGEQFAVVNVRVIVMIRK